MASAGCPITPPPMPLPPLNVGLPDPMPPMLGAGVGTCVAFSGSTLGMGSLDCIADCDGCTPCCCICWPGWGCCICCCCCAVPMTPDPVPGVDCVGVPAGIWGGWPLMLPRWLAMDSAAECVSGRGWPAVGVAVWGVCSALRAEFWVGVPAEARP